MTIRAKTSNAISALKKTKTRPDGMETLADLLHQLGDIPPERIRCLPRPGAATEKDVERSKRLCELVDGVLVEKPMSTWESILTVEIIANLQTFVKARKLGKVLGPDGLVRLFPGLVRAADVGFVSRERLKGHKPFKEAIARLVPDLAIEILSPSNTSAEMKRKLKEYFSAGVRLVWIINPRKQTAEVYTDPTHRQRIGKNQVLDGSDVLPGYQLSLRDVFEGLEK
jgi:Uma2 family endonuclease